MIKDIKSRLTQELDASKLNVLNPDIYSNIDNNISVLRPIKEADGTLVNGMPKTLKGYYNLKTAANVICDTIDMFPARMLTTTSYLEDHLTAVRISLGSMRKDLYNYVFQSQHTAAELVKFHQTHPIDELIQVQISDDNLLTKIARGVLGKPRKFLPQPNVPQTIITRSGLVPVSDYLPIAKLKKPHILLDMRTRNPVFYNPYLIHNKKYLRENDLFIDMFEGVSERVIAASRTIYTGTVNNKPKLPYKPGTTPAYVAETFDGNTARYLGMQNEIAKIDPLKLRPDAFTALYNRTSCEHFATQFKAPIKITPTSTYKWADIRRHIYNKITRHNIDNFGSVLVEELTKFIAPANYAIRDKLKDEAMITAAHAFSEIIRKVKIAEVKPKTPQLMELLEELINDKSNLFTILENKIIILKSNV